MGTVIDFVTRKVLGHTKTAEADKEAEQALARACKWQIQFDCHQLELCTEFTVPDADLGGAEVIADPLDYLYA
jgi:hypothetical protein